jgi:hypothetical protein
MCAWWNAGEPPNALFVPGELPPVPLLPPPPPPPPLELLPLVWALLVAPGPELELLVSEEEAESGERISLSVGVWALWARCSEWGCVEE